MIVGICVFILYKNRFIFNNTQCLYNNLRVFQRLFARPNHIDLVRPLAGTCLSRRFTRGWEVYQLVYIPFANDFPDFVKFFKLFRQIRRGQ